MEKVYKTKIDWWLELIVFGIFILSFLASGAGLWLFIKGHKERSLSTGGPALFMIALIVGFVWPMYYTITDSEIVVRSGIMRSRYSYDKITAARATHLVYKDGEVRLKE